MATMDKTGDVLVAATIGRTRHLTPDGFLYCENVRIASTKPLLYRADEMRHVESQHGMVLMERPPEILFSQDTMASFQGKPITNAHPSSLVCPKTWKATAVGTILNPRKGTGDDKGYLVADLLITDEKSIKDIQMGKVEVSCGYDQDHEQVKPGLGRFTRIIGNHVALVDKGRCGPSCAIGDKTEDKLQESEHWITIHPNGPGTKGQPILISRSGYVKGGLGGKFNGQHISAVHGEPGRAASRTSAHAAFSELPKEPGKPHEKKQHSVAQTHQRVFHGEKGAWTKKALGGELIEKGKHEEAETENPAAKILKEGTGGGESSLRKKAQLRQMVRTALELSSKTNNKRAESEHVTRLREHGLERLERARQTVVTQPIIKYEREMKAHQLRKLEKIGDVRKSTHYSCKEDLPEDVTTMLEKHGFIKCQHLTEDGKMSIFERLRGAFRSSDAAAFDAELQAAEKAFADAGQRVIVEVNDGGAHEEGVKAVADELNDPVERLLAAFDSFNERIEKLERAVADKKPPPFEKEDKDGEGEGEEDKKKKEHESCDEDTTLDAMSLATLRLDFQDTVAKAEILVPGIKLPTFDATAQSKKTIADSMCGLRKSALDAASKDPKRALFVSRVIGHDTDIDKMSCDTLTLAFNAATELARQAANAPKPSFDQQLFQQGPMTAARLQQINAANRAKA